jgi:hypothetical protein
MQWEALGVAPVHRRIARSKAVLPLRSATALQDVKRFTMRQRTNAIHYHTQRARRSASVFAFVCATRMQVWKPAIKQVRRPALQG